MFIDQKITNLITKLDKQLRTDYGDDVIVGVSVGDPDYKNTWRVDLNFTGTDEQNKQLLDSVEAFINLYDQSKPSKEEINLEAQRRIIEAAGASSSEDLTIKISNATREAVALLYKKINGTTWTQEEATRATYLDSVEKEIDKIRTASNLLCASPSSDYKNDKYWK